MTTRGERPMSNNLTIPAAVWACKVDGVPLVAGIVEGVLVHPDSPSFGPRGALPEFDEPEMRPPADLVALRDARCKACGGDDEAVGDYATCFDCVDGRPLVDLRVECATCEGTGDDPPSHVEADHHGPCRTCETPTRVHPGYRTVKGLVDVVPVVEPSGAYPEVTHLTVTTEEVLLWVWCPGESRDEDDFDPVVRLTPAHVEALGTIQPGQWAWTFTEVEA